MDFTTLDDDIAQVAHRCWCKRMLEKGWRPGKLLDPEAMTHDALRPHSRLLPEDQARLRMCMRWDELEKYLAHSASFALDMRPLSGRDIHVGMPVRLVDDPGLVGQILSWSSNDSEPDVLEEITVEWSDGEVVEYCPALGEIEPADD